MMKLLSLVAALELVLIQCLGHPPNGSYDVHNASKQPFAATTLTVDGELEGWVAVPPQTSVDLPRATVDGSDKAIVIFGEDCREAFRTSVEAGPHLIRIGADGQSIDVEQRAKADERAPDPALTTRLNCDHAFAGTWARNRWSQDIFIRLPDPASPAEQTLDYRVAADEAGWLDAGERRGQARPFQVLSEDCELMDEGELPEGVVGILVEPSGSASFTTSLPTFNPYVPPFDPVSTEERCA